MEFWNLSVFSALPFVVFPRAPHYTPHGLSLLLYCLAQARSLYSTIPRRPVPTHTRYTHNTGVFAKTKIKPANHSNFCCWNSKVRITSIKDSESFFLHSWTMSFFPLLLGCIPSRTFAILSPCSPLSSLLSFVDTCHL
jgi:hypothetical protein